jgi:hypothetical protein
MKSRMVWNVIYDKSEFTFVGDAALGVPLGV